MIFSLLAAAALGCTPYPTFTGFPADIDGRTDLPTGVRIPLLASSSVERSAVDALGNPGPTLGVEWVPDAYGLPQLLLVPESPYAPNTTYTLTARGPDYLGADEDSVTIHIGSDPEPAPGSVEILSIDASELGGQTDDCTMGTHRPRDLTVEIAISAASPLSWIELRNDDLRTWVSRPVEGPGTVVLDVFQPVMDEPGSDAVDCFTATLVSATGQTSDESPEFCLEGEGADDATGCGCDHSAPTQLGWALPLLLLIRRRR